MVYRASNARRGFGATAGTVEPSGSVELITENGATQKSLAIFSLDGKLKDKNTVVLKLERKGNLYTASCSADGVKFEQVGIANIVLKESKAGLIVCDGPPARQGNGQRNAQPTTNQPDAPLEVAFDYFHITSNGKK